MRLIWVVIPLVLIVLMIGIVGVQVSFASLSSPISGEMSLSNIPKLGDDAQLTITTNIMTRSYHYQNHTIAIILPPGFELIDAENFIFNEKHTEKFQNNKGHENDKIFSKEILVSDSDEIQTITSVVTINAVKAGNWTLNVPPSHLNIVVGEEESFLVKYFPTKLSDLIGIATQTSKTSDYIPSGSRNSSKTEQFISQSPTNLSDEKIAEYQKQLNYIEPSLVILNSQSYTNDYSLKKQLESGIAPEDILCKENRVLVIRTNGNVACVTERTAEKLGWEIISESLNDTVINPTRITLTSQTNPNIGQNRERMGVAPFTTLDYPSIVNIGEEFEIKTSWQFFELDENNEVFVRYSLQDNYYEETIPYQLYFQNDYGSGIEFVSTDGYELTTKALGPLIMDYIYEKFPSFENTQVHNDTLKFKINQANDYPFNYIIVRIDKYENYQIYIHDNNNGTLSLSTDTISESENDLLVQAFNVSEKTERYDKVIVEGFRYEEFSCDGADWCTNPPQIPVDQGPEPSVWDSLAEFVVIKNPIDVREFLRESNMTEQRIEEFLSLYPHLETQSFLPSFLFYY